MRYSFVKEYCEHAWQLQQIYNVTLVSNKGLVFMQREDFKRIVEDIKWADYNLHHTFEHDSLSDKLYLYDSCFLVAYDKSELYSYLAIMDFDFFYNLCSRIRIYPVLLSSDYDLIHFASMFDASAHDEVLGMCIPATDGIVEVEDA